MSRPDWGALQQEYIAEYTRSGISPVAWCEARGLNYATARRYIKKTPKNAQKEMRKTAQKSARKKTAQTAQRQNGKSQKKKAVSDALLIEGDTEEISFCPDEFGISDQQAKFAMLVAQGKKPTEAYRLAGVAYSRVSTFSGDYLRVTDNKGKTHDVLTGSDDGRHSNTSLAWGAGVQFNPTESVAIDIAYEGSGSGDWRTDGFIVGVGYKF